MISRHLRGDDGLIIAIIIIIIIIINEEVSRNGIAAQPGPRGVVWCG